MFSWISAFEIENKEVPDLKKLLQLAQESPDPDESEEDQQAKIDELEKAIEAWEDNLARNKEVREMAASGTLDPIQGLWGKHSAEHDCLSSLTQIENPKKASKLLSEASKVSKCDGFGAAHIKDDAGMGLSLAPHDLVQSAQDIDGEEATDEQKQKLRAINAIKFSGGGSTYTFTYDSSKTKSAVSGTSRTHEVSAGLDVNFGFKVLELA